MSILRILATGMGWPVYQPGGLNTYFRSICEKLSEIHDLEAMVSSPEQPVHQGIKIIQATQPHKMMLMRQWAFRKKAAAIMNSRPIDVLYTHFSPYALGPALEAKKRNIPVVMSFHGPWANELGVEKLDLVNRLRNSVARKIEMSTYQLGDRFIVLSQFFKDILHESYGIPLDKIEIVPGATNIDNFKPASDRQKTRAGLNIPSDRFVVLTVRRLVKRMGLLNLLEAWKTVVLEEPNSLLLIGGRGPLADELKEKIREYGLEQHVRLLGYVPEDQLPLYYQSSDLFVVPTQALEGFGLITIEALASGVPVVATPIGGNKEILTPFDSRFLFKDTSADAIAEGLVRLYRERETWPTSEVCRNFVLSKYTWNHAANHVNEVLLRTAGEQNDTMKRMCLS